MHHVLHCVEEHLHVYSTSIAHCIDIFRLWPLSALQDTLDAVLEAMPAKCELPLLAPLAVAVLIGLSYFVVVSALQQVPCPISYCAASGAPTICCWIVRVGGF